MLLPCGHGGYCGDCAHKLLSQAAPKRLCAICRDPLAAIVKVHSGTAVGAEGEELEAVVATRPAAAASTQSIGSTNVPRLQ